MLIMAVIMFPLWPIKLRVGVWYLSMGMLGLIGLFFIMAIFRLILFVATMFTVPPGLWLYPNLFEDVGFFDSFRPLWGWQEVSNFSSQSLSFFLPSPLAFTFGPISSISPLGISKSLPAYRLTRATTLVQEKKSKKLKSGKKAKAEAEADADAPTTSDGHTPSAPITTATPATSGHDVRERRNLTPRVEEVEED